MQMTFRVLTEESLMKAGYLTLVHDSMVLKNVTELYWIKIGQIPGDDLNFLAVDTGTVRKV